MSFVSYSFLALVAALLLLSNTFTAPRSRALSCLGASAIFLASYVDSSLQLLPLSAFMLVGYGSVELLRRTRSAAHLAALLLAVVACFVVLKRYSFVSGLLELPFPYLVVGLSYVLFRALHLMIDAQQGELLRRVPLFGFALYCVNFLSFTAGPIQRYDDFARAQAAPHTLSEPVVYGAFARVVRGFVKVGVVSAVLSYLFSSLSALLLDPALSLAWPKLALLYVLAASAYCGHLYANFAGYMDIVIGVGVLIGLPLPENFERPFQARNFLDFWSRWHMTLSSWFKTYLFNPLLKALTARFSSAASAPYLAVLAFFVTFLLMGLWHGASSVFVIYGLLLGAGASMNKCWQLFATKRFGKRAYKQLCEKRGAIYISRGLTFAYFALALTCLWVSTAELTHLAAKLGAPGLLLGYLALSIGGGGMFFVVDAAAARWRALSAKRGAGGFGPAWRDLALAAQVLLVLSVGSFFHKAPEFVYRAF